MWPGPAIVFEDRFFSFLQEQDFNGSMVAFFGCVHVSSFPVYLGVFARRIYDLVYKFAEMNIWGIDANTSQFVSHFACHGQFRSLMRM